MKRLVICSFILLAALFVKGQEFYNVLKFGAKNDSSALATKAIAAAIEAAVKKGGGTIFFPAGKYLTGPIHLKSNTTIFFHAH